MFCLPIIYFQICRDCFGKRNNDSYTLINDFLYLVYTDIAILK